MGAPVPAQGSDVADWLCDLGLERYVSAFREAEVDGEYDHLARVLEWSAGGPGESDE